MSMTIDPTTPLEPGVMNGTVAYAPPPVRSNPRNREAWLDLADDGFYQGWRVLVRMRFSVATGREMASGDVPRITEALKSMVLAQEGFTDAETGEPLPPARTPEGQPNPAFWDHVAEDEILLIIQAVAAERGKFLASAKQSSSS
jgi:hypothetical protein